LHDRMKIIGAELLLKTVEGLAAGNLEETPQSEAGAVPSGELKHAPKIFTETCRIDWDRTAAEVYNLVRGLSPYPAAFTFLEGKKIKLFSTSKLAGTPAVAPGTIETDRKTYLRFAAKDGFITVNELQLEGKKKMSAGEFLRGYRWVNS
jgi:methionyl-tRNA formyltransferase